MLYTRIALRALKVSYSDDVGVAVNCETNNQFFLNTLYLVLTERKSPTNNTKNVFCCNKLEQHYSVRIQLKLKT